MTYKNFLKTLLLTDQTDIVDFLLTTEKDDEFEACFSNKYDFVVPMPDGPLHIASTLYYNRLEAGAEFDDVTDYESRERNIFEWRLVPTWFANLLIQRGETVFKHMGSSWWGVGDVMETGVGCQRILTEIFNLLYKKRKVVLA